MFDSFWNSPSFNLPNTLTVMRIVMALVTFWVLLDPSLASAIIGGVIFTIAAVTDYFDGKLARSTGAITTFGKLLDPIADKLLVLGTFAMLSYLGMFSFWIIVPILIREITITIFRLYFLTQGVAVAAVKSGKQKTVMQITAIGIAYAAYLFERYLSVFFEVGTAQIVGTILTVLMYVSLAIALWLTLYSGYIFFRNNWHLIVGDSD